MKTLRWTPRAVLALLLIASVPVAARAQLDSKFDPAKLPPPPPLHRIQPVKPQRMTLPDGMVVFLLENHDLPMVTGGVWVRTTPTWVAGDKVGLAHVTGEVMRSGGTAEHSGDWLDDRLAAIGASIHSSISTDLASASFRCLSDNTGEVVGLFADVMRHPDFPDDKIELSKVGLRRSIASRNDEMIPLLFRTSSQAVYGKDSPYARTPEYATVEAIQRDDCRALYRKVFEPSRMVLAVYGDFKASDMKKLLKARFGDWKGAGEKLPGLPPAPESVPARLVFAPKDDVTQSGIILTQVGFRADDPDYPSMEVLEMALGGGFQSRLINRIRTERGLAYATGARSGVDYQRPGLFFAYSLTKSESTMVALDLLREEVRKVTEAPLTDQELQTAKESVLNQFVFYFEQPSSVLFRSAYFEAIGYPQDFLQTYQKALEGVTAQSVLAAARRKLHPDQMIDIVVGKEKDFDRPLDAMGLPVERVDISIPPPPSKLSVGEATPADLERGQTWLKQAAQAAGGSEAWAGINSARLEEKATVSMQGQKVSIGMTTRWKLPDQWLVVQNLPFGEMKQGFDGTHGWMSGMNQVRDLPNVADQVKDRYERSFYRLFGHPETVQVQALAEPQTIDGVAYKVAYVKSDRIKDWTLFFAPDGHLARMEHQGQGPQGPAKMVEIYSDWRPEGHVKYPTTTQVLLDGEPFMEGQLTSATFNVELDPELFKKPAQ